jgi:hypothetical protein
MFEGAGVGGERGALPRVGFVCRPDHEVFRAVARRVEEAGARTTFFQPGERLGPATLSELSLLVNRAVHPASFRALAWAERNDLPTWNGYETSLLAFRLVGYRALEQVGFDVPETSTTPPDGESLTKRIVDWSVPANGPVHEFHQRLVPARPVDYEYYVVDTGTEIRTQALLTTSKRLGPKRPLGLVSPHPFLAAKLRLLVRFTGAQALSVDFVEAEGQFWAVDLNPAPSFEDVGMVGPLTESVLARLETGPRVRQGVGGTHE